MRPLLARSKARLREAARPLGGAVVGAVVYGGPFSVFETDAHPFLNDEYRFIDACMTRGVPLLGICQGSQQIAHHLGAHVGPKSGETCEFGYYEVTPTADGFAAILRTPAGSLWQFRCKGGALAVEDSLWIDGKGRPAATQQLVVTGEAPPGGTNVSWLFHRAK